MATVTESGRVRWLVWASAALVLGVTLLVFRQVRQGELLQWDDDINIVNNQHLHGLGWENLKWMFTDIVYARRYMPLAWLDWAVDGAWFGLTATSCHVGNLLFHGANAVLVFLLLRRLLRALRPGEHADGDAVGTLAAVGGALLWAVHPLRVEVVAWASGRIYCQTAFFLLLSLLAYGRAAECTNTRRYAWWLATSATAFTASLTTYPLAMSFVAVLLVLDWGVFRRIRGGPGWLGDPGNRKIWVEKVPFLAATLLVVGITLMARFEAKGLWAPPPTLAEFSLFSRAMQAFYLWAYYVWKPLLPFDLAPVYTTLIWFRPGDLPFVLSAAGVLGVTGLLVWKRRRFPGLLALWLCHLFVLAPMLGLTEHPHYPNDRYSYLGGVVWSAGLAAGFRSIRSLSRRNAALAIAAGLVVGCSFLSARQIPLWHDSVTLMRYLLEKVGDTPYRADVCFRLGLALQERGETTEAVDRLQEGLRLGLNTSWATKAEIGLARIFDAQGRVDEALTRYREAIRSDPNSSEAHLGCGWLLLRAERPAEAVPFLVRLTVLNPEMSLGHYLFGAALLQTGRAQEAVDECEKAVRLGPDVVEAYYTLAAALIAAGRNEEAIACARKAVALRPGAPESHASLGETLCASGRIPEATAELETAVRLNPGMVTAQNSLGIVLAAAGRLDEAIVRFEEVTRLAPTSAWAHCYLGLALKERGRKSEAIAPLKEALRLDPNLSAAREALASLSAAP